jgi:hypothetical protein
MSKQWIEATQCKFSTYEQFKTELLATWWSPAQQGLTKCALYQRKYDPAAGLLLSAHFLKYVTMVSYLEPKLCDEEIIQAIQSHYPIETQRLLITTKLNTIMEALEVLKRLETLEEGKLAMESGNRFTTATHSSAPMRNKNEGQRGPGPVRQIQRYPPQNQRRWNGSRGQGNYSGRDQNRAEEQPREEGRLSQDRERREGERGPRDRRTEYTEEN